VSLKEKGAKYGKKETWAKLNLTEAFALYSEKKAAKQKVSMSIFKPRMSADNYRIFKEKVTDENEVV
jgi:hypothetical protein